MESPSGISALFLSVPFTFFLTLSGMSSKGKTHHADRFSSFDGGKEVTRDSYKNEKLL